LAIAFALLALLFLGIAAWFKYIKPGLHQFDLENEARANIYNNGAAVMKDGGVLIIEQTGFGRKDFDDRRLAAIAPSLSRVSDFRSLDLHGTSVTDAAVAQLATVNELRALDVSDTPVTMNGLLALQRLPKLSAITVSPGRLSNSDMKKLYSVFRKLNADFGAYLGSQRQLDPSTTSPQPSPPSTIPQDK